jgi:adenine-specific DNA-methyltransferase
MSIAFADSLSPLTRPFTIASLSLEQTLSSQIEFYRFDAARRSTQSQRKELGQFLTPQSVAQMMAAMFANQAPVVSILDAGAGVGSLFAACVIEFLSRPQPPKEIRVVAYEIDALLTNYLQDTLALCRQMCEEKSIQFSGEIRSTDFIEDTAHALNNRLFATSEEFTCAILNPPYRKINTDSKHRVLLRSIGIETSNLYTGFLTAAIKLLAPHGEIVAITPRSFCNGPYFRPFREFLLIETAVDRLHLFDSREEAFHDDEVLQETLILHATKAAAPPQHITITSSHNADDEMILSRTLAYDEVVRPQDPEQFIRVVSDELDQQIAERIAGLTASLGDLGLSVSTGRVVDFRAQSHLRSAPEQGAAPLIYPQNFDSGFIVWPIENARKPQALAMNDETKSLFVPNDNYVLVKRFSAKEEKRRIVSAVFEASKISCPVVGFENHLNYFHQNGQGLNITLAKGLAAFLNSSLVDSFFRQFNGHTQVNATDLRSLKYPNAGQLCALGQYIQTDSPTHEEIDALLEKEIFTMANASSNDPMGAKKRIDEAMEILKLLGLPRAQINERSALTLLALLDLSPADAWKDAQHPQKGITPIMDFMAEKYGKVYKPNTRETVRRQTVHQFLDAGLVIINPDDPQRPPNSPRTVYEIEQSALALLKTFGTKKWDKHLRTYLSSVESLKKRYAQEREMARIPVEIAPGQTITLSPGGQNILVKQILDEFAPRFTAGGKLLYVGDTEDKWAYFDKEAAAALSIQVEAHGKIPDVIIHYTKENWLVLIEAVTSHGPINPKRRLELQKLFQSANAGLVFVTAFLSRKAMLEYLQEISWETEVWVAEAPSHLIHFNGKRFLGPY